MNDKQIKEQLDGLQVRINEKKEEYKKGLITLSEYYAFLSSHRRKNILRTETYCVKISLRG